MAARISRSVRKADEAKELLGLIHKNIIKPVTANIDGKTALRIPALLSFASPGAHRAKLYDETTL